MSATVEAVLPCPVCMGQLSHAAACSTTALGMPADLVQHCGRVGMHGKHIHKARPKTKVEICACFDTPCSCSAADFYRPPQKRRWVHCTGELVVEGLEVVL